MAFFCLFRLDAYFLTIIAGIDNTERVASDFSNDHISVKNLFFGVVLKFSLTVLDVA